jgi:hypothetical protein
MEEDISDGVVDQLGRRRRHGWVRLLWLAVRCDARDGNWDRVSSLGRAGQTPWLREVSRDGAPAADLGAEQLGAAVRWWSWRRSVADASGLVFLTLAHVGLGLLAPAVLGSMALPLEESLPPLVGTMRF